MSGQIQRKHGETPFSLGKAANGYSRFDILTDFYIGDLVNLYLRHGLTGEYLDSSFWWYFLLTALPIPAGLPYIRSSAN